jgi:muramoyltetrapeptide carboxypeptidase LdcA involved in peptidoglycan recycling
MSIDGPNHGRPMFERPAALRPGGRIAVVAPSFPLAAWYPERVAAGYRALAAWSGCEVVVAPQARTATGFTAGATEERAAAFASALADPGIDAVFFTAGGFNSAEILPRLDFGAMRGVRPKIVIGYSDCCSLLLALSARLGWVTYHGPAVITQFGEYPAPHAFTLEALDRCLRTREPEFEITDPGCWTNEFLDWGTDAWKARPRAMREEPGAIVWRAGAGEGTLFGGNLETLNFLAGTPYWGVPDDLVLFFEATEAEAFLPRIRRALCHLEQIGVLARTRALLVGRIPDAAPVSGVTLRDTVLEACGRYGFPIIGDLPFGHIDPMITLPIGETCVVEAGASARVIVRQTGGMVSHHPARISD